MLLANGANDEFKIRMNDKLSIQRDRITEIIGKRNLTYWTVPSFHDEVGGQINGVNGIICFDFNGIIIVHMGDIGHILEEQQIRSIGKVDILIIPVDSYYIIQLDKAREIVNQLSPNIIIPMHYKTEKSSNKSSIEDLNHFAKMFENVKEFKASSYKFTRKKLKERHQLLILEYLTE